MSEPAVATSLAPNTGWLHAAEKGSVLGIRFMVWLATVAGRRPARLVVRFVAAWYVLQPSVRRASSAWWRRILGREPTWAEMYRHVLRFAETMVDRCFQVQGRDELFEVTHTGHEHLAQLRDAHRGAILLSAHLGSTSAMSLDAKGRRMRIRIVGYFKNARMINAAMEQLDPTSEARVVHVDPGSVGSVFAIRECIEAGDMLAIAGDRVGVNDRFVEVDFFGEKAAFPTGPLLLAGMLHCPVYLVFGLYRAPDRYELHCEPFADSIDLPRKDRQAALHAYIQRYAARLEHYGRLAPDNWFNFYDFWSRH